MNSARALNFYICTHLYNYYCGKYSSDSSSGSRIPYMWFSFAADVHGTHPIAMDPAMLSA